MLPAEFGEGAHAGGAELVVGHDDVRHVRHPLGRLRQALVVQLQFSEYDSFWNPPITFSYWKTPRQSVRPMLNFTLLPIP